MKLFTKKDKRTLIQKEIDDILLEMSVCKKTTKGYSTRLTMLERLRKAEKEEIPKVGVSPDTMAVIGGNLLGLVLIMTYERAEIITTKALGFIIKGRV